MPDSMVIWEAQFGDFFNVAQVIMDQFISSGEDKWQRLWGLVMLLPHAFEGMGPEHSSARLERFLALAAEDNVQIVYPSTPAQCFHMMRRQHLRPWRKPLVVMSPKSLLRHPGATSTLDELANGRFQNIIDDERPVNNASNTKRVLICSGKIYYELIELREKSGRDDIAVIRLEQLYPLDTAGLEKTLSVYADGTQSSTFKTTLRIWVLGVSYASSWVIKSSDDFHSTEFHVQKQQVQRPAPPAVTALNKRACSVGSRTRRTVNLI